MSAGTVLPGTRSFTATPPLTEPTGTRPAGKGLVINYGEGGYKMGKLRVRNFCAPPPHPQDRVKVFAPPPFKGWELFAPPFSLAKTSSFHSKNYTKTFSVPSSAWLKLFPPPPPLFGGAKLHLPPPPPVF